MRRFEKGNVVKETSDPKKALAYLANGYQETTEITKQEAIMENKAEPKRTSRQKKAAEHEEAAEFVVEAEDGSHEQPAE